MVLKARTADPEGASEPPELAPVEQSLRVTIKAMLDSELEALAVAVNIEREARNG